VKWCNFWVTSGRARSRDVISCHVTATSCELQPCRSSNVNKTRVFRLLEPHPGNFRWNHGTSESLPVALGHVTSFPAMWLPPPASYSSVGAQTYKKHQFSAFYSHFQVSSVEMMPLPSHLRSRQVTRHHFLSRNCHHLQVTAL